MALKNKLIPFYPLLFQIIRFGIIGFGAATVHFSLVVLLVEMQDLKPLVANIIGFMVAFQVSYWGHRYWTFSETTALHRVAFPRLFVVNCLGFIANESIFYVFLTAFSLPYPLALFFTLSILPLVTFTLGKLWVFR